MKYFCSSLIFVLFGILPGNAQTIEISGKLFDKDGNTIIRKGELFLSPDNIKTIVDQTGGYSFITSPGNKRISTQVPGYKPLIRKITVQSDTSIHLYLQSSPIEIEEVTIVGSRERSNEFTPLGSIRVTSLSLHETPKMFSEPDLLKSLQLLPGVVGGKDGSSDIYVRGGGAGQNIYLANGCYFFIPGHLLGFVSAFDIDFLESAELYKDYFPAELGGGASSVIKLGFKEPPSRSAGASLRLGLISSALLIEIPVKKIGLEFTAGLKRSNYQVYAPLLKKITDDEVSENLPPDNYSFSDGFLRLCQKSARAGSFSYLFFGNYDNGKDENITESRYADTTIRYTTGISSGWNNQVHALQWESPSGRKTIWNADLNYNKLLIGRDIFTQTDRLLNDETLLDSRKVIYSLSPAIQSYGAALRIRINGKDSLSYSGGVSGRLRNFSPNIKSANLFNDEGIRKEFGPEERIGEISAFVSSSLPVFGKLSCMAGIRLSGGFTANKEFFVLEPRLRLIYNNSKVGSPHLNFVRLSQFDHSIEGSAAGLRSMLWLPVSKEFGPEVSDMVSGGFHGQWGDNLSWSLGGYYKRTSGMTDFKPGASFIFDTTLNDMIDRVKGRAYGLETEIMITKGRLMGNVNYTWSRSKREWSRPEGMIWIPSGADRPHNFNLVLKYFLKTGTSFGMNWIFTSGSPATIYMHNTSYGEFYETKNNIRYFNYHRLDLSVRQTVYKRKFAVYIDLDIYNVYNRKNTYFFRLTFDEAEQRYYYKNISLFPLMPALTLKIVY